MTSLSPRFVNRTENTEHVLAGRIVTIGSAPTCRLRLADSSLPGVAAHVMFRAGRYVLQKIAADVKIQVNGRPLSGEAQLAHGDVVVIGKTELAFLEQDDAGIVQKAPDAPGGGAVRAGLAELVSAIVSLLKNRDSDVFSDLVASVSRLLSCDASRLVVEDEAKGERKTIARFPQESGLDRFSNRAIDFAKDSAHTVLTHEADWRDSVDPQSSLERNLVASVLCAPLSSAGRVLGYLYLDRLQTSPGFTEDDRLFCDSLVPLFSEILANDEEKRRQAATIARLQARSFEDRGGMIYESESMVNIVSLCTKIAATDSPVLIFGETGTGKELMARYVHDHSRRRDRPFKAINCGAIPETLIESELFGHEKGSFTGATQRTAGLFEAANGGTVLLDEIGELPLSLQVKLLRVLQDSEITRVGGTESIKADIRIVAATNKKLDSEVVSGRFRQDLFYRLNVFTLTMPPLRERGEDVVLLAEFLVKKYCQQFGLGAKTLLASAHTALMSHNWPGNVRELENVIQKAILYSPDDRIAREHIQVSGSSLPRLGDGMSAPATIKEARAAAEKEIIMRTLQRTKGNVSSASKLLDIDRKWLMKLMEELGINADTYRA
jgi:transcriptional regulator with GAF, ATPase, and Fis domain